MPEWEAHLTPEKGLWRPTVKHLFVLAKRHMIPVGVGQPNQAVDLTGVDQLKKRACPIDPVVSSLEMAQTDVT